MTEMNDYLPEKEVLTEASTGVLLVNLGTPLSPSPNDVYRYLIEFLTDARVIDIPWLSRQFLVRGVIVPKRYKQSAKAYKEIWTPEGAPLLVYGKKVRTALQNLLGPKFHVELAMRYQFPSIQQGIDSILKTGIKQLIILPLFPQYASATTGSVHQRVFELLKNHQVIPKLTFINEFATHPMMISAFCDNARQYPLDEYDKFLFSFHGLPERQIRKADSGETCLKKADCCQNLCKKNQNCYSAQCHATAYAIAQELNLPSNKYEICFQSRLGKDPWLQPYASAAIADLAKKGNKKVLVFCPSFVCDCLETTYEIGVEYAAEFKHAGGEKLELVKGLNDHPMWVEALRQIVISHS